MQYFIIILIKNIIKLSKFLFILLIFNYILYLNFILIDNNKISIIIPTYNRAKLILYILKSILNQSYRNIETIIVDDNSSDNTKEKLNMINDTRIRYIKLRKNRGACFARNIGIKKLQVNI